MSAVDSHPLIAGWLGRFERLQDDIQMLLLRHQVFHRLQAIVQANPKLHRPSYLFNYLEKTYSDSAAIGVRRHARPDDPERESSLIGLLFDIRRHPEVLTRQRHVNLYAEVGMPADIAEEDFDRLAGPGAPHLECARVQADVTAFTDASHRLERYATQHLAHLDREPSSDIPKFSDLDDAFGVFEALVRRYRQLLRGDGGPVVPIVLYPWEWVLMEPWIPPS